MDLQKVRATAESIARDAGEVLMRHWMKPHTEVTKKNIYDIVTDGDKASEAVIVAALREAFPDHHIVSEEGGGTDLSAHEADYYWYIDPIDGTTNFAHNLPHFSISIALAGRDRVPLVGVVLNPVTGEMFSAARGHGATLGGEPIRVTNTPALDQALLATGFSTDKQAALEAIAHWRAMIARARDLRRLGSAALDLCYVACGRLDGFWESDIHGWDVQAGILIVDEAGGKTSDYSGGTEKLYTGKEVLASNGHIHEAMLDVLRQPVR